MGTGPVIHIAKRDDSPMASALYTSMRFEQAKDDRKLEGDNIDNTDVEGMYSVSSLSMSITINRHNY